jgi:hypothetical protein
MSAVWRMIGMTIWGDGDYSNHAFLQGRTLELTDDVFLRFEKHIAQA